MEEDGSNVHWQGSISTTKVVEPSKRRVPFRICEHLDLFATSQIITSPFFNNA